MNILNHRLQHSMKVLVVQRGARHRYAIPRLLEEEGLLSALYTDSCIHSSAGHLASLLPVLATKGSPMQALASRIPGIPQKKVFSSDRPLYSSLLGRLVSPDLSSVYRQWGLQDADIIYSMYGEDIDFLDWAKAQGAKIIIDVFVHPETNRIVSEEEAFIHGSARTSSIRSEDDHSKHAFELADLLLCPSEWVAGGIREFSPEHAHKIRIVPYGSSVSLSSSVNNPEPGRILFAGRHPLRKGLHHLAKAAYLLRKEGLQIDVRVAGITSDEIDWMEHHEELNCLGTVPMEQMKEEYDRAMVFVLPSLSEGQAGVLLEAMACGCAVVATKESGVDFEPGCGVTVPVKDATALAKEIGSVITDESYRNSLAEGALRQADDFSMDAWKQRLVGIVEGIDNV